MRNCDIFCYQHRILIFLNLHCEQEIDDDDDDECK